MHYYQFNIGNYSRHTSRLSLLEDLAYRRLLDLYYLNEKPFCDSLNDIARNIGMAENVDEVSYILTKYFTVIDNCFVNETADKTIKKYHSKSEKAKQSAQKRWNNDANAMRTHTERNANQEPITNNNKPITKDQEKYVTLNEDDPPLTKKIIPFKKIIEIYHELLPDLPKVEKLTKKREGYIRQRWLEDLPELNNWENYFEYVSRSDFLMGRTDGNNGRPPFRASLEWLTNPSNFAKVSEEKYHV